MDDLFHGKPYEQMDALGGFPTPIFGSTPISWFSGFQWVLGFQFPTPNSQDSLA